ncbi:DUF3325 family protein [uncultured Ramlibacter sp.]|uniref:DUF3325 family protein n=1 Tax=uncultured Ramlibacter sp. TaxID=260755 RepID=UPI00261E8637|nr:DUF3325 family protein [uncultured Ramlibacter sp.]
MSHAALVLFAWLAAACGFAALALAMDRHHEDAFGRGRTPGAARRWLRAGGSAGLLVSLLASLAVQGPTQGWVLWLGVLTAAALAVVLALSYGPRRAS